MPHPTEQSEDAAQKLKDVILGLADVIQRIEDVIQRLEDFIQEFENDKSQLQDAVQIRKALYCTATSRCTTSGSHYTELEDAVNLEDTV